MRSIIIVLAALLLFLITNYNELVALAQEQEDFTISINPGATNSASQNPIAPANLTISKDTTITWVNNDSNYHQIISGNPDTGPSNIFYGDYFGPGESYNVTFDEAGIYQYYDPNWSHINGQITVEDVESITELETIENTSDITNIDQVSTNGTNIANEINSNTSASVLDNNASISSSSLLGSLASDESNQSAAVTSPLSTLSTDQTLNSIIDKVGPLFSLLSGNGSANNIDSIDSITSALNDTLEESMISGTNNLSSSGPTLSSYENIEGYMNNTNSLQNSSTSFLKEEKAKAQEDLADSLIKAISVGAKIPDITGFDDHNATIYIKVNVINPEDRIANASDFPIQVNYNDTEGIPGVSMIYANEAGMIQKLPASTYNVVAPPSQTGDQSKDAFLNSYISTYSKGCSGDVSFMETKDCIVTKQYSNLPLNNTTVTTN